ncbi:MFS transporter [Frankia alni]|uniref:MFS transporter n=1 Tax=Frankia alni TaxID=1859 RepID=UPI0018D4B32E|nr:MFS transporter [Frankia alni]
MYVADTRTRPAGPGAPPGLPAPPPATRAPASPELASPELASPEPAGRPPSHLARRAVPATVLVLGAVSLITDVSAEMVTAVLPLYLVTGLGLSPLGFGLLDGIYNGASALVRLVGGHLADRGRRHKAMAALGYGLSALCKPALLIAHSLAGIGAVLAVDRTGKGLRTAPRDAMISLAAPPEAQGRSFGVHRAMDTAGALLGPVVAVVVMHAAADGFDAVFTVSFCVAATGVVVLLLFVPGRVSQPEPAGSERAGSGPTGSGPTESGATEGGRGEQAVVSLRAAVRLLGDRALRRLALCALLLGLATVSDSFLYLILQRDLNLSGAWFPLLPLGTSASFLLLAVPLGRAADRFGRWRVFLAGHGGLLAAYGLLLASVGGTVAGGRVAGGTAVGVVVLVLHGAFYAATDGVLMAAAAGSVPAGLRSSGLALVQTGQVGARFACSLLFGAAWTAWGDRSALAAATVALAACTAAAVALRPGRAAPPPAPAAPRSGQEAW